MHPDTGQGANQLLRLDGVVAGYGDALAVDGVSLEVHAGEIVALLGANGAGKTSTVRAIMGLIPTKSGSVEFRGNRLEGLSVQKRVEMGLALVPEDRELWPDMSVIDNLKLGAFLPRGQRNMERNLEFVLSLFPSLAARPKQLAGSLSGGEQQMCAVGRALMTEPSLLLLDEPTLGLSPILSGEVLGKLEMFRTKGTSILLIEQNVKAALERSDRAYVMDRGRIVSEGVSDVLASDPAIRATYMGTGA